MRADTAPAHFKGARQKRVLSLENQEFNIDAFDNIKSQNSINSQPESGYGQNIENKRAKSRCESGVYGSKVASRGVYHPQRLRHTNEKSSNKSLNSDLL